MKKCKIANQTPCGKTICCFDCEEKDSCNEKCGYSTFEGCENLIEDEEGIKKFQTEQIALINQIADFEEKAKKMEAQKKALRENLKNAMELYGVKSFKNDKITITYVAETISNKFSSTDFKKDYPDMYEQYKKPSKVSASIRIELKENA